ncbi:MAG: alpha-L-arabinofuranosidase C-terminal domain-containing protein [Parabacteroides sp.]|nr:alpha-L-arabinofuranosidase C-terminal domain-containing protein [Parabacteroides sp.]
MKYYITLILVVLMVGCRPEMPVTSSIRIEKDGTTFPVNQELYGLTIEEINHAIDGGIYAELIQNRSFEDGVPPLNCRFDAARKVLITPNGWTIPFLRADSIPGWRRYSPTSYIYPDTKEVINEQNRRSLLVSVTASSVIGKGGVIAEGYGGIPIREGEKYDLSFYIKGGSSVNPKTISLALADSAGERLHSELFQVTPIYEWQKYKHTFTATETTNQAVLTITADTSTVFWLDVVSLFPQKTWKERPNGCRPELMERIAALNPQFIRFPGGSFVEGYTAGTYPMWRETIGKIDERKHFWNVWAYGSTNGLGYHEYLQMCEDLEAEPVYVIHSGITSQTRRPRYEDITVMKKLVQEALDAIAYANEPADSLLGSLRAKQGHPEPFGLKYVEIGSENKGDEYTKRFNLFKNAIHAKYPDITVISSSQIGGKRRNDWVDTHFYTCESFLMSNYNRYTANRLTRRIPAAFIGEFGLTSGTAPGSMRAAISEACFLVGVENGQDLVRRLAYAPVVGNTKFKMQRYPAISFDGMETLLSPSYHLFQMFANNRGDEVLHTEVQTYQRPQVTFGRVGIKMFDDSYDFKEVKINGKAVTEEEMMTGNYLLIGDSSAYDYTFTADIKRTKGNAPVEFRVRDNGMTGEQRDYIGMTIGTNQIEFYRQAGSIRDTLRTPVSYPFQSDNWYQVQIACQEDWVRCFVNDTLIHEVQLPAIPSLVTTAALDKENRTIILKVVNTTQHEEKTELSFGNIRVKDEVEVIELKGEPEARNTFEAPHTIEPQRKAYTFAQNGIRIYKFPPNSVTLMILKIEE